ncbi:MAG: hypothetical protein M3P11_10780 [Actinomycetota bacterium]|nr:hypothetical protein [Actinomycetota bacterium]
MLLLFFLLLVVPLLGRFSRYWRHLTQAENGWGSSRLADLGITVTIRMGDRERVLTFNEGGELQ